jgi:CheY-like chemotaxis protein
MQLTRSIEILLVEDNPGDVNLTRIALADRRETTQKFREIDVNLSVVADGVEAMDFLNHQGQYAQAVHPDLILLDWNLPRKDGREVLLEIKADERLQRIPVVVLTTSQAEEDILRAYNLHAARLQPVRSDRPIDRRLLVQDRPVTAGIKGVGNREWGIGS